MCNSIEEAEEWVVIKTEKEYCVVVKSCVFCVDPESLAVGDKVQFSWSKKTKLVGTVCFINDSFDLCDEEAQRLNKIKKVVAAPDQPASQKRRRGRNASEFPNSKETAESIQPQKLRKMSEKENYSRIMRMHDSGSGSDSDDDSPLSRYSPANSTATGSETDDSLSIFSKLQERFGKEAMAKLASGACDLTSLSLTSSDVVAPSTPTTVAASVSPPTPISSITPATPTASSVSRGSSLFRQVPVSKNRLAPSPHQTHGARSFEGQQYIFTAPVDPSTAVEVYPNSGIFCSESSYLKAENATSATMVARRLIEGVYTREALLGCSISGLPPRGKGKEAYSDPATIKPFLCPKGVNAIVCQAITLQKARHFLKKKDDCQIRQAMSVRLSELHKSVSS